MRVRDIMEADRIGSAIRLDELPPKYRSRRVVGRGFTSIVLDDGPESVVVCTRDKVKSDWLRIWLGMADWIETIEAYHGHNPHMARFPIHVLRMPRLYPLDAANRREARRLTAAVREMRWRHGSTENVTRAILDDGRLEPLHDLAMAMANYQGFSYDLSTSNFMQDADGKLVVLDPVLDEDLVSTFRDAMMRKYR